VYRPGVPRSTSAAEPTPTARPGAAQLLAMGAPTEVELDGATAVVTASGPAQLSWHPGGRLVATWDFTIELD